MARSGGGWDVRVADALVGVWLGALPLMPADLLGPAVGMTGFHVVGALALMLTFGVRLGRPAAEPTLPGVLLVGFLAWLALVGWWRNPSDLFPMALAPFVACWGIVAGMRGLLVALPWVGVGCAGVLGVALLEVLDLYPGEFLSALRFEGEHPKDPVRLAATFFHANLAAWYLLTVAAVALACLRFVAPRWRVLLLVLSMVAAFFLVCTFSRGVLLGAMGLVGLAWWGNRRWHWMGWRWLGWWTGVVVAGVVGGMVLTWGVWGARFAQIGAMGTQSLENIEQIRTDDLKPVEKLKPKLVERMGRLELWARGWRTAREAVVVGRGAGSFGEAVPGHLHAHNLGLEVLLSGGLVGLALGVLFLGGVVARVGRPHVMVLPVGVVVLAGAFDCFLFFPECLLPLSALAGVAAGSGAGMAGVEDVRSAAERWAGQQRLVLVCGMVVFVFLTAGRSLTQHERDGGVPIDLFTYYAAVRWVVLTGEHPYVGYPSSLAVPVEVPMARAAMEAHGQLPLRFFYPPTGLVLLGPLGLLPQAWMAGLLWWLVQVGCVGACVYLGVRMAGREGANVLPMMAVLLQTQAQEDIAYGNVSLVMAALGALFVWWMLEDRPWRAGAVLAAAVALKVFPVMWLLVGCVWPRRLPALVGGMALGSAVVVGATVLWPGWDFWGAWRFWVLGPLSESPPVVANISLQGQLEPLGVDKAWMHALRLALLGLALAPLLRADMRGRRAGQLLVAGALLAWSLLAVPLAWMHYSLIVMTPIAACLSMGREFSVATRITMMGIMLLVAITNIPLFGLTPAFWKTAALTGLLLLPLWEVGVRSIEAWITRARRTREESHAWS